MGRPADSEPVRGGVWGTLTGDQPGLEERVEVLARHLLGQALELLDRAVAALAVVDPGPEDGPERRIPDQVPQRLERHRAADVDRPEEDVPRPGITDAQRPEGVLL